MKLRRTLTTYVFSMALVSFQVRSDSEPSAVLAALTDFSPRRPDVWPNIDSVHFRVHAEGPGWAEVTEGSRIAGGVWERSSYTWHSRSGTLAVETLESNVWGPGSRWDYRLTSLPGGGSLLDVTVVRNGKGLRGHLLGAAISLVGVRMLRSQLRRALAAIGSPPPT